MQDALVGNHAWACGLGRGRGDDTEGRVPVTRQRTGGPGVRVVGGDSGGEREYTDIVLGPLGEILAAVAAACKSEVEAFVIGKNTPPRKFGV